MANAIVRQIVGDKLTKNSKSKGKAFLKEMASALAPAAIAKTMPMTQSCKGYSK